MSPDTPPEPGLLARVPVSLGVMPPANSSAIRVCPNPSCRLPNLVQATLCLQCGADLTRPCPRCGFELELVTMACPRCQTIVEEYQFTRYQQRIAAQQQLAAVRDQAAQQARANSTAHLARVTTAVIFWMLALVALGSLVVFSVWLGSAG